jgi:hypothetical protein
VTEIDNTNVTTIPKSCTGFGDAIDYEVLPFYSQRKILWWNAMRKRQREKTAPQDAVVLPLHAGFALHPGGGAETIRVYV